MEINTGATAWVLICAALILLMTPGLAFFYGGLQGRHNVLGIMMQCFCAIGVVSVTWALIGFSLAFDGGNRLLGGLHFAGLTPSSLSGGVPGMPRLAVPVIAFALYQMMGAVITPALVTGAAADRWRFAAYILFLVLWPIVVYAPVAHWVFSPTGWAAKLGALDFGGGMVVHANAGAAAVAMAMVLGHRVGWPERQKPPHSVPLVMIGAGILWFGWLGYNGGAALNANGLAALASTNTNLGGAAALLTWIAVERVRTGKPTVLGAGTGALGGLVAVTPCAGFITPMSAILIGALAGVVCCLAVGLKAWLILDDSLDVIAVHLVGGCLGTLCLGLFATKSVNPDGANGLFHGGGLHLFGNQLLALTVVVMYSLIATYLIGMLIDLIVGNRVSRRQEWTGLDLAEHGELAYAAGTPEMPEVPEVPEGLEGLADWSQPMKPDSTAGHHR
ncbi:ammonium transporter [Frankia sp. Cj3]|uniref:ammonium transporter n=1 Tax=Frankia sp. Cj3 TaxID=2880976 RepID=UPI001EF69270|nr:ammonium transporter [Frankia sp. Cj3]